MDEFTFDMNVIDDLTDHGIEGEHDVDDDVGSDAKRQNGKKKKTQSHAKKCYVDGCNKTANKMRRHVTGSHLPWFYHRFHLKPGKVSNLLPLFLDLLTLLCMFLLPSGQQNPTDLLNYVLRENLYPMSKDECTIRQEDFELFIGIGNMYNYVQPKKIKIQPPNFPPCVLHVRVLVLIMNSLSSSQRNEIRKLHKRDSNPSLIKTVSNILAIDTHWHPDSFARRHFAYSFKDSDEFVFDVPLSTSVKCYCYPYDYPDDEFCNVTFGIHPKNTHEYNLWTKWLLKKKLQCKGVVGVGECGLDYYSKSSINLQLEMFVYHLELAKEFNLPIVIHCREKCNGINRYFHICLENLKKYLDKSHKIHWHCFGGGLEEVRLGIEAFPNVKFGVTGMITLPRVNPDTIRAIANIDMSYLMLESDSPHLVPNSCRKLSKVNHPNFIGHIAKKIAEIKNMNVTDVVITTTKNAKRFYELP